MAGAAEGGGYLVFTQREPVNSYGDWSVTVGYQPTVAGRKLICAYSDDGYTNTLARAEHAIDVSGPGGIAAGKKRCKRPKRRAASSATPVATAAKKCKRRGRRR